MVKILGIDIEPKNSPLSLSQTKYSIVIIDEKGDIIEKMDNCPLSRVIRLAWEQEISIIATDNIYELGSNDREIIKAISLLPDNVEVVQVTYINGEFRDIRDVAKNYGIDIQGKPNSTKTAYLAAILALKGAGTKIKLIENKTKIVISRGRHLGPGGMSSNRYKRHIRGLLLRVFKQVKESLDKNNIDYDVIVKRTKSGIENATFIVYAPRESLFGIVKKMKGHDVNLEIKPVYKTKIEFGDKKINNSKPLIVGIDPGLEVGISVLDLYGNPILLTSRRSIDREDIIMLLREKGLPVLLATDVNPLPDAVKKLSAALKAKVYIPEKSLSVDEKQQLLNDYCDRFNLNISDPHIRDSLGAALKAYKDLEKKLRQGDSVIRRFEIDIDEDKVFRCIMDGNTIAECIEKEIENKLESKSETRLSYVKSQNTIDDNTYKHYEYENTMLKHEINRLRSLTRQLFRDKAELEKRIEEIKLDYKSEVQRDRKIYELNNILEQKNKIIEKLQIENSKLNRENERLNILIYDILRNKIKIINSNSSLITVKNGKLFILDEEINTDITLYIDSDFALIEPSLLNDIYVLNKEKEIEHTINIDEIKKIIENYRNTRSKEHNFSI
jgi:predicted RNase H-like nuclease (RuvC/YqgF family)